MDSKVKDRIRPNIPQEDFDRIYRMQQRTYWEIDFIDRCVDRRMEGTGLCNIPYETLADESVIQLTNCIADGRIAILPIMLH